MYSARSAAFRRRWRPMVCRHAASETRWISPVPGAARAARLSPREREAAILVPHGLPNREIANRLVIATRTAENHVQHIFVKLAVSSRAQVAAWMAAQGLLAASFERVSSATAPDPASSGQDNRKRAQRRAAA